jgi:O-methyltransferase
VNTFLVDCALNFIQRIPVPVRHNVAKANMISTLLFQLNLDQVEGDYYEFGVAHGNSLKSAVLARRFSKYETLGVRALPRSIFAFDTFESFASSNPIDSHPVFVGTKYASSFDRVVKRFHKEEDLSIFKIDVCKINENHNPSIVKQLEKVPIDSKAVLVLLDMDLYEPTICALNWIRPRLQEGTYLMFDDFYYFRGDPNRGERKALTDFLNDFPSIEMELVDRYGSGGQVFQIHKVH